MSGVLCVLVPSAGKSVQLIGDSIVSSAVSPGSAGGTVSVNNTGTETDSQGRSYNWLLSGAASSYEILATLQSSSGVSSQSGTYGTWLSLSFSTSWTFSRTSVGTALASILLQIRPVGGSPIASCVVSFDCEVTT